MNVQGRHAFWNVPRPMLAHGPYRTVPLSLGRQFIGYGNPFLGQDKSINRLENLSIPLIQNRILIAPPLQKLQEKKAQSQANQKKGWGGRGLATVDPAVEMLQNTGFPTLTNDEQAVLTVIAMDPTSEELEDLALIDGFFSNSLTVDVCKGLKDPRSIQHFGGFGGGRGQTYTPTQAESIVTWMTYVPQPVGRWGGQKQAPNISADEIDSVKNSSFFCETPKGHPALPWGTPADWFGIDPNQAWGNIKPQVKNAMIIMDQISTFPFPPPIDQYVGQWWATAAPDLKNLAHIGSPVDPGAVRMWITLSVAANYSAMVDRIQAELKRKAKKAKRKALMKAIGLVLLSIIAIVALPATIALAVSAIQTVITTYQDIEKRKKAAKDMMEAAKMFEKDAPAYSAELEKTAKVLDEATAIQTGRETPSPEVQAAIEEVDAETPSTGISPLIPGGIAAAGLAAFLIFR